MQEETELRGLKIFEYEKDKDQSKKISIDNIEDRVQFIIRILHTFRQMQLEARKDEGREWSASSMAKIESIERLTNEILHDLNS